MKRKKMPIVLLILGMFATGCGAAEMQEISSGHEGSQTYEAAETHEKIELNIETEPYEKAEPQSTEEGTQFSFGDLKNLEFYFSSGAGAWRTVLEIGADGSFSGVHSDSDMGDAGEGYPDGTFYICEFDGRFTQPEKVNEYTYSMQIDHINYKYEPETQEILDGVRYLYSTAYGLDGSEEILIYLPGAPFMELPQEYQNWVRNMMVDPDAEKLPFYGLYNVKEQNGFSSHGDSGGIHKIVADSEAQADAVMASLQQASTQTEMNEKSVELYVIWDDLLNDLWRELKDSLPEEEFQNLLEEQRAWIAEKEQAVNKAGEEFAGGTMQPMARNTKASELTKERVYELYEVLKQAE